MGTGHILKFLIKDRIFYKTLIAIALPIALQNVIGFGVGMMDTIMVGSLGDTSLSAAALGNQPFFVFMVFNFGLASGGAVLISQYWGRGNVDAVRRIIGMCMRFVAVAAVIFSIVCFLFPTQIISLFSSEADVIGEAAQYLKIVALSYSFYGVASCYLNSLRAVENVRLSMLVYAVSFVVNVMFNYLFIFGKFGFPKLDIVGAAVGTCIARISEILIVVYYILRVEKNIKFNFKYMLSSERELLPDYIRHSLPVVGSELAWSLGIVTQAAIIGNIGKSFVAANSIASVLQQLSMVMMLGIGNAAAVVVGKAVGAGKNEDVQKISKTLLALGVGVGIISCGLMLVLRYPFAEIYNATRATKDLAINIMGVMAALTVGMAIEIISIIGILRGAADTKYAFFVDAGCTWLIGVPMGFLAGFVWKLPVVFVYVCLRSDLPFRIIFCLVRILRGRYIKNVTRDM